MVLPVSGYYILATTEGRWGGYSEDIVTTWNSHLMLKHQGKHPLGKRFHLQFLGSNKVAYNKIDFDLPTPDRNYGVRLCERCGTPYTVKLYNQRFCRTTCRVNSYLGHDLNKRKQKILEQYKYRCSMGPEKCKYYRPTEKLIIYWAGDKKPYCRSCFYSMINKDGYEFKPQ